MSQGQKHMEPWAERSNEVREILGKEPSWVINLGTVIIGFIITVIVVSMAFLGYNDIISAEITITSKNPPVHIEAKRSGRLKNIFIEQGSYVKENQVLAEIENTADLESMEYLQEKLKQYSTRIKSLDTLQAIFPNTLALGSIQVFYGEFLTQYQNQILFNVLSPSKKEQLSIENQLQEQKKLLSKQKKQLELLNRSLALSANGFTRSSKLYEEGILSKETYERDEQEYLSARQQYEDFLISMSNTQIAIANFDKLLTKSSIDGTERINLNRQGLERAYQMLMNGLLNWEQQFLLKSPISGHVTLFDVWNKYQNFESETRLFTIVPDDLEEIIGRVSLPIRNSGKVKTGQIVNIKLEAYPFEEWGSLSGTVTSVSEVPNSDDQRYYVAYVKMSGLTTSYGKKIAFKQEMQGSAEIIVEKLTVLDRIFYQFRKIMNKS